MRIGLVSDIHGNAAALERALALMGAVDEVFCLGDCINEYRFSNETVKLLRERGVLTIRGNHEEMFFSRVGERARAAPWIDRDLLRWLEAQPARRLMRRADRQILLVHATPWAPRNEYVPPSHPAFLRFAEAGADIVLYGHTHQATVRRVGTTLIVNPGSTGHDGSYAVVDLDRFDAVLCR